MIKYSIFALFLFLFSCQNKPQVKPEPVVEEPEQKEKFKYKTYKRITGISNIESNLLKKHKLQSVLIVTNSIDEKLFLSARNLKDVGIATVDYLDPALMLSFKNILIVKDALEGFEKRFGG